MDYIISDIKPEHFELFFLLSDALVHETTAENILPYLDDDFPKEKINEYLTSFKRPSQRAEFKQELERTIRANPKAAGRLFVVLCTILDSRILSPFLTKSLTLVRDMSLEERADLLRSWRDSPIELRNRLFKLFHALSVALYFKTAPEIHHQAIGYPGKEARECLYENQVIEDYRYTMLQPPQHEGNELYLPNIDAVIIGSGSGAGVVANTLTNDGYKVLVLEKGKYFPNSELTFNDAEGYNNMYEKGGGLATADQGLFILAGSTFGGGSAVNWSACLKTPFKVRKEWYDKFNIDWVADETYEQCQEFVWKQMGASDENITHSFSNQVLLDGSKKLGYKSRPVAQNSGGHPNHSCGFCYLGCRYGVKQGSVNCWFRDAADKGCQFMDQVKVQKIIHRNGKATGLECIDNRTGKHFRITGPRKFIASSGSLHTPCLLQKSGFKNKHIGANLKLHPVTVLLGDFGHETKTKPYENSIMTSVCTQVDDLDGKAHGAKIETILHSPYMESIFTPWKDSDQLRRDVLKYNNLAAMLILTRDTSSGTVKFDADKEDAFTVDYTLNKFDRNSMLQAILVTADILYVEGVKVIIHPQNSVEDFESNKPKHERSVTDSDYVAWRNKIAKIPLGKYSVSYGSAHQMASCRISGKGPSHGAADLKGRLFECKNVYIADASAMPSASGANPMITTMAFARKIALDISKDLKPQLKL